MSASLQPNKSLCAAYPSQPGECSCPGVPHSAGGYARTIRNAMFRLVAGIFLVLMGAPVVLAQRSPPGCTGSGLGISLFTSIPDVHIGDTIRYSVNVFNAPFPACDASAIKAFIVTPDGVTNMIALRRTSLIPGEADMYTDVVSYVVRAQDLRPDGTVRATATDEGDIAQNDTKSRGGSSQGVNTEVNLPCVKISAICVGSAGENGEITFTGSVTNCGNTALIGLTVTNLYDGGIQSVLFPTNLAIGQVAVFSGSYIPANPCGPNMATLTVFATDQFTSTPRTVTSLTTITCQNTLTQGIQVTKVCPSQPVAPGQLLTFTGSVSNTGNVTLTNIVVVNSLPSANTPIFTRPTLAPGEVVTFNGSYLAPTNCTVADTLTATAASLCGVAVRSTATATCPILTTPTIALSVLCPVEPVTPGGSLIYSGTVRNTGDVILNDIVVISDVPAPNSKAFSLGSLAPGASATFSSRVSAPADGCALVATFSATARDACAPDKRATNTITVTCQIVTAPAIAVTLACPPDSPSSGGPVTYTGTVRNSGNVRLKNVVIVNNQPAANTRVFGPITLAPGEVSNFSGTFAAPSNACSVVHTVVATGGDDCTEASATATASATCSILTAPALVVTQDCPTTPAIPGGPLTFSGTVRNSGNVSLTNVSVVNNLSGSTPVFTAATLAPGETLSFTGSYLAPTNCSSTSSSIATGRSICGIAVSHTASATCPILTSPAIVVTQACPVTPVLPGGLLTFTGTVRNSGDVLLTNIVVVNNWPVPGVVVFTASSLAPGATRSFSGSYQVPVNCCVAWSTLQARGQACEGVQVSDTDSGTCTVLTSPQLVVTENCPPVGVQPGEVMFYSGTVRNAGNITLVNVTVVNSQSAAGSPLLGPITLAPGETVPYDAPYLVTPDFCGVDTVTAHGLDACSYNPVVHVVTVACPAITTPRIAVTKRCPTTPTPHDQALVFSGTVSNPGNVTLVNVYVVNNQPTNNTPVIGPITLVPGASLDFSGSYTAPPFCCEITDTLTARGQDRCTSSNVTATATAICPLLYTPSIAVVQSCPPDRLVTGSLYSFSGFVTNTGDAILTNVVLYGSPDGRGRLFLGPLVLAPGESASYSGSLTVPFNSCSVVLTASSQETCNAVDVTGIATCLVATSPMLAVSQICPVSAVNAGDLLTYSGTVSNAGNITLTGIRVSNDQGVVSAILSTNSLPPGGTATFSGAFVAPAIGPVTSTSTVDALTPCGEPVTGSASSTCPILVAPPITPTPVIALGLFRLSFASQIGKQYSVQYKTALSDPVWTDLMSIAGTGGNVVYTDPTPARQSSRFYRVIPLTSP